MPERDCMFPNECLKKIAYPNKCLKEIAMYMPARDCIRNNKRNKVMSRLPGRPCGLVNIMILNKVPLYKLSVLSINVLFD